MAENSAEVRGQVYIIAGKPMSLDELIAYQAEEKVREEKQAALRNCLRMRLDQCVKDWKGALAPLKMPRKAGLTHPSNRNFHRILNSQTVS